MSEVFGEVMSAGSAVVGEIESLVADGSGAVSGVASVVSELVSLDKLKSIAAKAHELRAELDAFAEAFVADVQKVRAVVDQVDDFVAKFGG